MKKRHGVAAPHSSPMKIIGVKGLSRVSIAAMACCCRADLAREPFARGPVADLIMVVGADDQPPGRRPPGVDRMSVGAAAEAGASTGVEEAAAEHLAERGKRVEVGVVAAGVAGQAHVEGVVEVVAPLGGQTVAAALSRGDQPRVVEVGLGDERHRSAQERAARGRPRCSAPRAGALRASSCSACTASRRSPSTWIVGEEHQRVVDDVAAHLVGLLAVEVRRIAPDVGAGRRSGTGPNCGR